MSNHPRRSKRRQRLAALTPLERTALALLPLVIEARPGMTPRQQDEITDGMTGLVEFAEIIRHQMRENPGAWPPNDLPARFDRALAEWRDLAKEPET